MAQVLCPKCRQPGLMRGENGQLRCPRHGCGYVGRDAMFKLEAGEAEKMLAGKFLPPDLNFSIQGEDVEAYLARLDAAGADLPDEGSADVQTLPEELKHLEEVAEELYASCHGVRPHQLTFLAGREEAHKLVPILRALAERAWREGAAHAIEDLDGCHGCATSNHVTADSYTSPYENEAD